MGLKGGEERGQNRKEEDGREKKIEKGRRWTREEEDEGNIRKKGRGGKGKGLKKMAGRR